MRIRESNLYLTQMMRKANVNRYTGWKERKKGKEYRLITEVQTMGWDGKRGGVRVYLGCRVMKRR